MNEPVLSDPSGGVVKPAGARDRRAVQRLVREDPFAHRHLGWIPPLEWLGQDPFLLLEEGGSVRGVLACPPDRSGLCWLRLFAAGDGADREAIWDALWRPARGSLQDGNAADAVHVLVMGGGMEDLVRRAGFEQTAVVVVLDWEVSGRVSVPDISEADIQLLRPDRVEQVHRLDQLSFDPIWRNTAPQIRRAFRAAAFVTGAFRDGELVGFQISTAGALSGHLARLAVDPAHRGTGIGKALVADALDRFGQMGMVRVSVNTQQENAASLEIYRQFGFVLQDDTFPVYSYVLDR